MNTPYDTPTQNTTPSTSNKRLKSVSPLKAGIVLGTLYAVLTLFMMLIFVPFVLIGAVSSSDSLGIPGTIGTGIGLLIFAPVLYGIMGFIGGVICAAVYNLIAKITGGLVVTVEDL
jgi:hypothetical protein